MRMFEIADRPRKAKAWRSEDYNGERRIYHYSTKMLSFNLNESGKWDGDMHAVDCGIGHGSVSDQNGMNKLFAYLGMPLYFSRKGGAEISELDSPQFRYGISR